MNYCGHNPSEIAVSPYQKVLYGLFSSFQNGAINPYTALKISGKFDKERFQKAFSNVVSGNDALRSYLKVEDNDLHMYVYETAECEADWIKVNSEEEIRKDISEVLAKDFGASGNELFCVKVYELSENEYILFAVTYHVVSDGDSIAILMQKLLSAYQNPDFDDSEITHTMAEYNQKELEFYSSSKFMENCQFWKNKLELNDYIEYPKKENAEQASEWFVVPVEKVKKCAGIYGCTYNNVIMTAYHMTLCRMLNKNSSGFFFMYANRTDPSFKNLIAPQFQATFSRVEIDDKMPLKQTVRSIFMQSMECISHSHGCLLSFDLAKAVMSGVLGCIMTYNKMPDAFELCGLTVSNFDVMFNSMKDTKLPCNLFMIACSETKNGVLICPLLASNGTVDKNSFICDFTEQFQNVIDCLCSE